MELLGDGRPPGKEHKDPMKNWLTRRRIAISLLLVVGMVMSAALRADTLTIQVGSYIDGQDLLHIQGNTVYWQYVLFDPVGTQRFDIPPGDTYTSVITTLNGNPVESGSWTPSFPNGLSQDSTSFTLDPALPSSGINSVSLTVNSAREVLDIIQFPTIANGEELILNFEDSVPSGASYYEGTVTVDFTPSATPVPEPGSMLLLGSSLVGLAGVARHKIGLRV
jgi:hypothetical protein